MCLTMQTLLRGEYLCSICMMDLESDTQIPGLHANATCNPEQNEKGAKNKAIKILVGFFSNLKTFHSFHVTENILKI